MSSENNVLRSNGAERIGIAPPDEWQPEPEQSTGAVVVPNLHAKYIAVCELTPRYEDSRKESQAVYAAAAVTRRSGNRHRMATARTPMDRKTNH